MRKPLFWRDVNLAIGAGGLASTVAAARLPAAGEDTLQAVLIVAGSTGLLIGICDTIISVCEKCGGSMLSRRWARRLGVVLFVLGLVLTAGLGYLLWILSAQLMSPGRSFGGVIAAVVVIAAALKFVSTA
ncbi:MAG: hypothetical protein ABIQ06_07780 [Caldimonas sp.]